MEEIKKCISPIFRVSFPKVFKPESPFGPGDPKFSLVMLWTPQDDLMPIRKLLHTAVVAKWGPDKAKWPAELRSIDMRSYLSRTGKDGWPLRDGNFKESMDGYAGMIFASASTKADNGAPAVWGPDRQPIIDQRDFYAGCYAVASLTAYAYDNQAKGVALGLGNIMKIRDGKPFGGRSRPEDDFNGYVVEGFEATGTDDFM